MNGFVEVLRDEYENRTRAARLADPLAAEKRPSRTEIAVAHYLDRSGLNFDRLADDSVTILILDDLGPAAGYAFGMAVANFQMAFEAEVPTYEVHTELTVARARSMVDHIVSATMPVLVVAREQSHLGDMLPKVASIVRFAQVDQRLVDIIADAFWPGGEKVGIKEWEPNLTDVCVALKGANTREGYYESILTYQAYVEPEKPAEAHVPKVKPLSQMVGFGEAQDWGLQLAADLKRYKAKEIAWEDMDVGVLLSSPPGGGKTTFARALAAECGLPFFPTTYTEWAGGKESSGDTISKALTKLFAQWRQAARDHSACIVFVDEIDSIGKRGVDWRQDYWFGPVINSWLAFLDGAVPRDGIVVIAATNFPDRVDDAMRRPGRLDRHLVIPMPNIDTICGMLYHHLGTGLDEGEVRRAATALRGRNPAEIMQVTKDARRHARSQDRPVRAIDVLGFLPARLLDDENDRDVCVHEAGHVIVALDVGTTVVHVDADRSHMMTKERSFVRMERFRAKALVGFGGRAAEEVVLGVIGVGCAGDLRKLTGMAREVLFEEGRAGLAYFEPGHPVTPDMVEKIEAWLQEMYAQSLAIVARRRFDVVRLAHVLHERRYLTGAEVAEVLRYRERFRVACEAGYEAMDRR